MVFLVQFLIMLGIFSSLYSWQPTNSKLFKPSAPSITLLGKICCGKETRTTADLLIGLPILYKGCEYEVKIELTGSKRADFELYDNEKSEILYLIFTPYLKLPHDSTIEHLETSPHHTYRIFKLTRFMLESDHEKKPDSDKTKSIIEFVDSWNIEELDNTKECFSIPDNAVIIFIEPEIIEKLEPTTWASSGTTIKLPTVILKNSATNEMLEEMTTKMRLAFLDFKFLHRKPYKAYVPCTNNHVLSMPFSGRSHNC